MYLGQTTKDPYIYLGSGKYWRNHLKRHGTDHLTEVIRECASHSELKEWGIFYSNKWDIVKAKNFAGKKIWANEKPEEGTGGSLLFSEKNPMKNPKTLVLRYGMNHENHHMKDDNHRKRQSELVSIPNAQWNNPNAKAKKTGENHYLRKNSPNKNPVYDHTVYKFENIVSGEIIEMTQHEFRTRFNASAGNVSQMVRKKESPKSVKGWRLL